MVKKKMGRGQERKIAVGNRRLIKKNLMKKNLIAAAGAGRGQWIRKKTGIRGKMGIEMGAQMGISGKVGVGIGAGILDGAAEKKGLPSEFSKIILRKLKLRTG